MRYLPIFVILIWPLFAQTPMPSPLAGGGGGGAGTVTSVATSCGLSGGTITATGTVRILEAQNAQTGTTDTVGDDDCGKLITYSNGSAIAVTLPQANGSTFIAGWFVDVSNQGAGTVTVTPTTSTIDGAATLVLTTNQGVRIVSNGTNYFSIRGIGGSASAPSGTGCAAAAAGAFTATRVMTSGSGVTVTNGDCTGNPTFTADTAVMLSRANAQAGTTLSLTETSASGTTYTFTMSPTLTAYTANMHLYWKVVQAVTGGATTVNMDTLGAKSLFLGDCSTNPPAIAAATELDLVYNGTAFCIQNMPAMTRQISLGVGSGDITSTGTKSCSNVSRAGRITGARLLANALPTGANLVVDVKTVAVTSYTGIASASSVTAAAVPTIATGDTNPRYIDTTLTGWTTTFAANTVFCVAINTAPTGGATWASLVLTVTD